MTVTDGLPAQDVATTIIRIMGWQETARTSTHGIDQERIEHLDEGRWIGVTSNLSHTGVTLHAGRIQDGVYASPEADSGRLDGADQAVLALAVRRLWQRLDDLENKSL